MKKKLLVLAAALSLAAVVFAQRVITQPGYTVLYDDYGRVVLVVADSATTLANPPQTGALLWRTDEAKLYQWSSGAWSSTASIGTTTGNLVGNVTGNVTGDVTGSISGGAVAGSSTGLYLTHNAVPDAEEGTAADCGGLVTNAGDTDGSAYTTPNDPTIGCAIVVQTVAAQTFTLTANTDESLQLGPDACAAGTITLNAVGDGGLLVAVTGGSGAVWVLLGDAGSTGGVCNDA